MSNDEMMKCPFEVDVGYASAYPRAWDSVLVVFDMLKHNLLAADHDMMVTMPYIVVLLLTSAIIRKRKDV